MNYYMNLFTGNVYIPRSSETTQRKPEYLELDVPTTAPFNIWQYSVDLSAGVWRIKTIENLRVYNYDTHAYVTKEVPSFSSKYMVRQISLTEDPIFAAYNQSYKEERVASFIEVPIPEKVLRRLIRKKTLEKLANV